MITRVVEQQISFSSSRRRLEEQITSGDRTRCCPTITFVYTDLKKTFEYSHFLSVVTSQSECVSDFLRGQDILMHERLDISIKLSLLITDELCTTDTLWNVINVDAINIHHGRRSTCTNQASMDHRSALSCSSRRMTWTLTCMILPLCCLHQLYLRRSLCDVLERNESARIILLVNRRLCDVRWTDRSSFVIHFVWIRFYRVCR